MESNSTRILSIPMLLANLSPVMRTSYSASLLRALKPNFSAYNIFAPWGPSSTRPAPLPARVDDPSICSTHTFVLLLYRSGQISDGEKLI